MPPAQHRFNVALAQTIGYEEYDPLNKRELGRSVDTALVAADLHLLDDIPSFYGVGIYAIYVAVAGAADGGLYDRLAGTPVPVYVGRAQAEGVRKGLLDAEDPAESRQLWKRLREHRASIVGAEDLHIRAFVCRWLTADMLFVPMAEALMIQTYRPVWNSVVDGFGNHSVGGGRGLQRTSPWDVLHPGRGGAAPVAHAANRQQLGQRISDHLDEYPPEVAPPLPPAAPAGAPDPPLRPDLLEQGMNVAVGDPPYGPVAIGEPGPEAPFGVPGLHGRP